MRKKGYEIRPIHSVKISEQPVWYYYYDLPEGLLELEVELNGWKEDGSTRVTAFRVGEHSELLTNN